MRVDRVVCEEMSSSVDDGPMATIHVGVWSRACNPGDEDSSIETGASRRGGSWRESRDGKDNVNGRSPCQRITSERLDRGSCEGIKMIHSILEVGSRTVAWSGVGFRHPCCSVVDAPCRFDDLEEVATLR